MKGAMATMQDGMQQQLANNIRQLEDEMATMQQLENKFTDKLAAVVEDVTGLQEEVELKTRCLREEQTEEVESKTTTW